MDFDFIKDSDLRKKIEDSVEYIYAAYEESKKKDKSELFRTETFRVIVLYTVSIIEAVLFDIYHQQDKRLIKEEYKETISLPKEYIHTKIENGTIAVVVIKKTEKDEIEIGFQELVKFLEKEKVLQKETVTRMLEINNVRNTLHLRKERVQTCTVKEAESALELLLYTLQNAPRFIKK